MNHLQNPTIDPKEREVPNVDTASVAAAIETGLRAVPGLASAIVDGMLTPAAPDVQTAADRVHLVTSRSFITSLLADATLALLGTHRYPPEPQNR